ncbi:4Fe-4S binding domain protein [Clostridiales bacterium oral taxon 876 str. F0540]|nr:4Fe-4S binding domain protein [Clostridiales bacterium oral taxon 876 str. F0540]
MANMFQLITRNLFNKKKTRLFPLSAERPAFERSRGRIVLNPDTCILCSICARRCPADAIKVDRKEGFWELDAYRCIICGECVGACPKKSISMNNDRRHAAEDKEFVHHKVEVPIPAPKPAAPKPAAAAAAPASKPAAPNPDENKTNIPVAVKLEEGTVETPNPLPKENTETA